MAHFSDNVGVYPFTLAVSTRIMDADSLLSRRAVLAEGVAASVLLAGCSGGGGGPTDTATATGTATATDSPTGTPTGTPTETATPTPEPTTVENFEYPEGAGQAGIEGGTLYETHRSTIIDAGSVTVDLEQARSDGSFSSSFVQTNAFGSDGLSSVTERGDLTESLWSPGDEEVGYVRMDTGFDQRYRIDNTAPRPQRLIQLPLAESLLAGASWTEALEVEETGGGEGEDDEAFAVVYEATGVADERTLMEGTLFGDAVSEFTATIAVTAAGYLHRLTYDITVERDGETIQREATAMLGALGTTTVSEPSWAGAARENGVRFSIGAANGGRLVELEMLNGADISGQARANLSASGVASGSLGQPVTVGDTLYLGLSGGGDLLVGVNEMPDGATDLGEFAFASLRRNQFTLFEQDFQL